VTVEIEPFDRLLVARLARMARTGGNIDESHREVAAHAVAAVRESHGCLTPALYALRVGVDDSTARTALRSLETTPLVRRTTCAETDSRDGTPFVIDELDRIYLARYFDHQRTLARRLVVLASTPVVGAGAPDDALLARLFPRVDGAGGADSSGRDHPREAAESAASRAFTIISGGPGTGKTSTVVKVLALLVDAAQRAGREPPRTLLLAPTGKAAARLAESIRASRDGLDVDARVREAIPDLASTVHRALGVLPGGGFVRGPSRTLDADVVLVDEASMIDLALMRALVDAIRPGTRVILLGDRDQLASVEAGSVLADLCDAASRPGSPLEGAFHELVRSHRFAAGSGIGALAAAIREGDAAAALAVLDDANRTDVALGEPVPNRGRLPLALQRAAREGFAGLRAEGPEEQLAELSRYRVLTAHRVGSLGVTELGIRVASSIGRPIDGAAIGTPVLVLENDVESGLSNGDVGVVGLGEGSVATTYFASTSGPRAVAAGRLPRHEPCWAMSIHKSQGSEFDHVSVVVPDGSLVASRELLYTAVTRARQSVSVHASRLAITACIDRRIARASGLADAIVAIGGAARANGAATQPSAKR